MGYVDAILHIADYPALAAAISAEAPDAVDDAGTITGFAATPAVRAGAAALVYVRLTETEVARWRGTPGVTVLAETPYDAGAADRLYGAIFDDPTARALYDALWPRSLPHQPERFGMIG